MFESPEPTVNRVVELNDALNAIGPSFSLGNNLRRTIARAYHQKTGKKAQAGSGITRFYSSDAKYRDSPDSEVAKAVVTYPFWKLLVGYRNWWKNVAESNGLEWSTKAPFPGTDQCPEGDHEKWVSSIRDKGYDPEKYCDIDLWKSAVENSELDETSITNLWEFLNYHDRFKRPKGISRPDFSQSALNSCIVDQRSEVLSYLPLEISESIDENIYAQVASLIEMQEDDTQQGVEEKIIRSKLTQSLLAKPFLILTGPSGTGKTRSAYREAKRTGGTKQCCLVPVGADWTDNRHVLGFLNPLETIADPDNNSAQIPVYETTPIVDLILAANAKPEAPHFLILDEMNLSHVERYFADFLSAMELEDKTGALKLHSAGAAASRSGIPIPQHLDFPENLFVIGTVNVDETTYMFSPKVLDRANVIEIRADANELGSFLRGDAELQGETEAIDYGVSFLDAAMELREGRCPGDCPPLPDPIRQEAADRLMQLFRILKKGRFEFGFRTGNEVLNFLRAGWFLAGPEENDRNEWAEDGWKSTFGDQVLQKLLPKLHGSKSRLSPLLGALGTWCATGNETLAMKHFPEDGSIPERSLKNALEEEGREFNDAYEKIVEMIHVLNSDQFVSFIC